ncbi:uncharacterized protein LOC121879693 isoform X2 [Homarus americanus]|uniref:uncharacterized protein LOC121879693 isoform X2 n=1 Tax=Homarus americanus TaxID=6706 RepID=UPI001C43B14D|nr:uncharacterized protein LOC121879693 isoform X2 [Homarus americanus]
MKLALILLAVVCGALAAKIPRRKGSPLYRYGSDDVAYSVPVKMTYQEALKAQANHGINIPLVYEDDNAPVSPSQYAHNAPQDTRISQNQYQHQLSSIPSQQGSPLISLRASRPEEDNEPLVSSPYSNALSDSNLEHVLRNAPSGAQLYRAALVSIPEGPIHNKLISNYTKIRPVVKDTFSCVDMEYGYYADVDNECQLYHLCVPLRKIYGTDIVPDLIFHYSFICPNLTVFMQDSMTCGWPSEAMPCEDSPSLYMLTRNFFRKILGEDGELRYAQVNSPLPSQ